MTCAGDEPRKATCALNAGVTKMPLSDADAARALDAWLQEHVGSAERQAAVRGVADRLEDLTGLRVRRARRGAGAVDVARADAKRFVAAWRRLKADAARPPRAVTPGPRRARRRPASRPPPPLPLSPASSASATSPTIPRPTTTPGRPARALLREVGRRGSGAAATGSRASEPR